MCAESKMTDEAFDAAYRTKRNKWPCTKCDCTDYNGGNTGGSCQTKGCGHKGSDHEIS